MQYRLGLGAPQLPLGACPPKWRRRRGQVMFGPIRHRVKHFAEGFAACSKAVLHAWRGFPVRFTGNHTAAFKFFQSDSKCPGTNATDVIHKLGKAAGGVLG